MKIRISLLALLLIAVLTSCTSDVEIKGKFSVSSTQQVYFSKGNLQYQASTKTWRFAEHQWDFIGSSNKNICPDYDGWIDLFGWGTGDNPTMSSRKDEYNEVDYENYSEWGDNIIDPDNKNNWRTLTHDEWDYVLYRRETISGIRYAKAIVNGKRGVVIFPDDWRGEIWSVNDTNNANAKYIRNKITASDWKRKFESNGAIFLPAAGYRLLIYWNHENKMTVGYSGFKGYYWTSTDDGSYVSRFEFSNSSLDIITGNVKDHGMSVRLVINADK